MKRTLIPLAALCTFVLSLIAPLEAVAGDVVFFTNADDGTVERVDADGMNRQTLVSGLTDPQGIAVDDVNGLIFWADATGGTRRIVKANLDGSGVTQVITFPGENVYGIAVDPVAQVVYWAGTSSGSSNKCTYAGGSYAQLVNGIVGGSGLALDLDANMVYVGGIASVYKSDITVPLYSQFSGTLVGQITDLAVDPTVSPVRIFFVDPVGLYSDDENGSDFATLVNSGVTQLSGIEVSPTTQRIYFSDRTQQEISVVDYAGGNRSTVLTGAGDPVGLSILYLTPTPTPTPTATPTPTSTATSTATPTWTPTSTPTRTPTTTPTATSTSTALPSPTAAPTIAPATPTAVSPTSTPTPPPVAAGTIEGVVRIASSPLSRSSLAVSVVINGGVLGTTQSDESGRFTMIGAEVGVEYTIVPQREGYVFQPPFLKARAGTFVGTIEASPLPIESNGCTVSDRTAARVAIDGDGERIRDTALELARLLDRLPPPRPEEGRQAPAARYEERVDRLFENLMYASLEVPVATFECSGVANCDENALGAKILAYRRNLNALRKNTLFLGLKLRTLSPERARISAAKTNRAVKLHRSAVKLLEALPARTYVCR